ncbi:hypothetical protein HELRODRAFT_180031 [Helobdella robusta]|uniref:Apple domain-containing protein n=1 Tax=Helobdella robusta TaxID=6412 RepID=T1FFD2_HELRO|nr:hypothetical protein HELRODRAFT_180031 [Helobdella robusta]ESN94924.1 hypothetical protein HELRODRAFT_180031 [Helobdella robusta]
MVRPPQILKILALQSILPRSATVRCRYSFMWMKKSNMSLAGFQFKQFYVRSALDCMHMCKQLGGCDSINFHPASKLCQMNAHINGYASLTSVSVDEADQRVATRLAVGAYAYNSSGYFVNSILTLTAFWAVDGRNGLNDVTAKCSLTTPSMAPHWIGVDLANVFSIFYTILYAGTDINSMPTRNDLDYFIVGVSNRSLDVHPPVRGMYDLCAQYPGVVASKQVVQLNCSSTTPPARYVILQQPANSTGYMSVCEWEIYGISYGTYRNNMLIGRPARSSSVFYDQTCGAYDPALLVDGFHDNFAFQCHCSHTNDATGGPNWFMVDMMTSHHIDFVVLSAMDYEGNYDMKQITDRMYNFIIGLTNVDSVITVPVRDSYPLCARWPGALKQGVKVELKCNANLPKFRYVVLKFLKSYSWIKQSKVSLVRFQFKQLYVRSALDCMHKCKQLGGCDSINFHPASKLCQMNTHINGQNDSVKKQLTKYDYGGDNFEDYNVTIDDEDDEENDEEDDYDNDNLNYDENVKGYNSFDSF